MTPIAKNIVVVDELGNERIPTYAKRAQGLVNKGRARWLDEHTICLACPPNGMEDIEMDNTSSVMPVEAELNHQHTVTIADILARLDRIIEQSGGLADVVRQIHDLPVNEGPEGGMDGGYRAEAISNICVAREETRRKEIDLLTQIYQDMLSPTAERDKQRTEQRATVLDQARQLAIQAAGVDADREVVDQVLALYERQLDTF